MTINRWVLGLTVICVLLVSFVANAEDLKSVEAKIVSLNEKVDSYTGIIEIDQNIKYGEMHMTTKGTGTIECMKKGDTFLYRMDNTLKINVAGNSMEQKMLMVFDGENIFIQTTGMGQTNAMKMKSDAKSGIMAGVGESLFKELKEVYNIRLLPEESVDGKTAYVFELDMKDKAEAADMPGGMGKSKLYISKDTGIQLKVVMHDAEGNPVITTSYKDIKLNVKLAPEHFNYSPPAGVTVMDMSNSPAAM